MTVHRVVGRNKYLLNLDEMKKFYFDVLNIGKEYNNYLSIPLSSPASNFSNSTLPCCDIEMSSF